MEIKDKFTPDPKIKLMEELRGLHPQKGNIVDILYLKFANCKVIGNI